MLESFNKANNFEYKRLTEDEQAKRGILGRLVGIIADSEKPTRNGRKYSRELWENVFENPIMKEKIENRVCLGELGHPADRTETDIEKVAICLAEPPKVAEDGKVYGVFDILNTPNGKILKSLCDYGCNIGISSRGEGDLISDYDGNESVDPDTYDCECWDAVLLPAVKEARLKYVTESVAKAKRSSLLESLNNMANKATDEDKKIMQETIRNLKESIEKVDEDFSPQGYTKVLQAINDGMETDEDLEALQKYLQNIIGYCKSIADDYNLPIEGCNTGECEHNLEDSQEAVENNEAEMIEQLQEALSTKKSLEGKVIELQEKLSVSYAKEARQRDLITSNKTAIAKLSEEAKRGTAMQERYAKLEKEKEALSSELNRSKAEVKKLKEDVNNAIKAKTTLKESINGKSGQVTKLTEELNTVSAEKEKLTESVANLKKDLELKTAEYGRKIEKANKLVEKYQKAATRAVDKYIESQAIKIGVSSNEIKNRLPESYTFSDIDKVTEDLQGYKLNMSKLPFELREGMRLNGSASSKPGLLPKNDADEIDESLLKLAGIK